MAEVTYPAPVTSRTLHSAERGICGDRWTYARCFPRCLGTP